MSLKDDLIHRLGALLVGDDEVAAEGWQHLALVGVVDTEQSRMTGFSYDGRGEHEPAAPRNFETLEVLRQLRSAMADSDGKSPWKSCLVRIARDSGKIAVDFEYDDAARWAITRANAAQRAVELKPA
jgi:hypothetical protein